MIDVFTAALAKKASRASADIIAFNIARHQLENTLADFAGYVNQLAQRVLTTVALSGCPYYDTTHAAPDTAPPAAPTGVVLRHGDLPGEVVARYHADRSRSINEAQVTTGDPNVEAGWGHAGMFSGGKATLSGLTPMTMLWVRLRTVGIRGVMGAWSDPAKIVVT